MSWFIFTVLATLRAALDWFNAQPGGTQTLIGILLTGVLASVGSSLWWLANRIDRAIRAHLVAKRAAREIERQRLEAQPPPIGLMEALIAEEAALRRLPECVEALKDAMTKGVDKQEEIKERMARLNYAIPSAKHQANKLFLEHADNYNHTSRAMRKIINQFNREAKILRECQERYAEWNRMNDIQKPPGKWIDGYDTFVTFRDSVRKLRGTVSPEEMEKRWDAKVRAMNRKFDGSVREFVKVNGELAEACGELDAMCTMVIDTVEKWKRGRLGGFFFS